MASLLIKNGEIVTADRHFKGDVYCEDGIIAAIGADLQQVADQTIDAAGQLVLPGGIDAHTHMELPFMGGVSSDDFFTGTRAGLAGGTTTIVDFIVPNKGQSLIEAYELWKAKAAKACADYGFHMCLTWYSDQVKEEMHAVWREHGISSFKIFLAYTGAIGIDDDEVIKVLEAAGEIDALISVHAEHGLAVQALQNKLVGEGKTAPKYHAQSRPSWLEGEATHRAITLAKLTQQPLYIVHMTAKEALDALYRARAEGQVVYGETCPQYLLLDDSVYEKPDFEGAAYVMSPPIRPRAGGHQDYLWSGLANGQIQVVATDHCPFTMEQKRAGEENFMKIPNGAAGIENRMALIYTYGVATGRITLERFVDACCTQPAKLFRMYPQKGTIAVGSDADIVLYDPNQRGVISAETHHHRVDRSIFEGFEIKGAVTHTIARGVVRFAHGTLNVEEGSGRYIPRP
ncbi:dihydropyrimidinase [Myxococcota bacterium]|nr:dihydropyrimidinase [Myxococcota bacterium]MBU1430199.1 dihydropyrimidinase [Myxococcota bacterium]MBU1897275.1 dihydropyrimidinase [Myxococcota bacterium]